MCPVNIAGQPMELVKALRHQGVEAHFLEYEKHAFNYKADRTIGLKGKDRVEVQFRTLQQCLEEDYDIFHFWLRTFLYGYPYKDFMGMDLPFIKRRGIKVVYRFTGNDLRLESVHRKKDPFSFFKYGYKNPVDEQVQRKYLGFLKHYVDEFIVQDPEMHSYLPEAKLIPRAIDVSQWDVVGVQKTNRPLVVHVPSNPAIKGTSFVRNAVKALKKENVPFEYKEASGISHQDAIELYKKADVVIDELLIGWFGVLSLECMAMGKPVMTYVRNDLMRRNKDIPVENVNINNLKDKLRTMIGDFRKRKVLADRSRQYVKEHHDANIVAKQLKQLYQSVLNRRDDGFTQRTTYDDLRYFKEQYQNQARELQELRKTAVKYNELLKEVPQLRRK